MGRCSLNQPPREDSGLRGRARHSNLAPLYPCRVEKPAHSADSHAVAGVSCEARRRFITGALNDGAVRRDGASSAAEKDHLLIRSLLGSKSGRRLMFAGYFCPPTLIS